MFACPLKAPSPHLKTVDQEELLQEQKTVPNLLIIDVREQDEWSDGHIEGAQLIPLKSLEFIISKGEIPKDTPVVCYCASGRRSGIACELFLERGYTNVRNLKSGFQR